MHTRSYWGDIKGKKTANANAQKAAKALATAAEHDRRQGLITSGRFLHFMNGGFWSSVAGRERRLSIPSGLGARQQTANGNGRRG